MRGARGFSFVETIIVVVVLGIAVTGVLLVSTTAVKDSADPMLRMQAIAIAESYLEEILAAEFADPGGPAESGRADWDNVGDYAGLSDTGAANRLVAPIAGLEDYDVTVSVTGGNLNGLTGAGNVLRVTVTVTDPSGESISLDGYKTNY